MMFIIYNKKKSSNIEFSRGGEHLVATIRTYQVIMSRWMAFNSDRHNEEVRGVVRFIKRLTIRYFASYEFLISYYASWCLNC